MFYNEDQPVINYNFGSDPDPRPGLAFESQSTGGLKTPRACWPNSLLGASGRLECAGAQLEASRAPLRSSWSVA
jgi:hypothetical protein